MARDFKSIQSDQPKLQLQPNREAMFLTKDFGLEIAMGNISGFDYIHKFGEATSVASGSGLVDIWDGVGDANADVTYTYSTTADIDSLSSSNANDTQDIEVQGLDTNFDAVTQTITLNGQTRVALTTSLVRVFRMKNVGTTDIAGNVYCYVNGNISAGVPDISADIRAIIQDGNNQTLMALYTVPNGKTGYLKKGFVAIANKQAAVSSFTFSVRPVGEVFQIKETGAVNSAGSGSFQYEYPIPLKIIGKSDLRVRADTSASGVDISAAFDLILVDN